MLVASSKCFSRTAPTSFSNAVRSTHAPKKITGTMATMTNAVASRYRSFNFMPGFLINGRRGLTYRTAKAYTRGFPEY